VSVSFDLLSVEARCPVSQFRTDRAHRNTSLRHSQRAAEACSRRPVISEYRSAPLAVSGVSLYWAARLRSDHLGFNVGASERCGSLRSPFDQPRRWRVHRVGTRAIIDAIVWA